MKNQSLRNFIVSSAIGAIGATTGLSAMAGKTTADLPLSNTVIIFINLMHSRWEKSPITKHGAEYNT